jgi:photosystem II stability/assembly factor-like uncharacterized protein
MFCKIRWKKLILVAAGALLTLTAALKTPAQQAPELPSQQSFAEMKWRLIGPFRGGRVLAVSGVPGKPNEYYFGGVAGGVWKTTNSGRTWQPIFDSAPISSIGALAVAPSDPKIIYVGSGEADMRSDISFGDGIYKSTDGGATWRNIGLRDSRQIGRILVDPRNPNPVFVAALGHGYGPNEERGVYRSSDGGETWKKILGKDENTGAIDLCFEPDNPDVLYASLWQVRRLPWSVYGPESGPGSGLYKSTDGGNSWKQITGHGFPSEGVGRTGIAVAPGGNGRRVYAIVDAREGGLYRSDDAGVNWRRVSSDHRIWGRGWYFGGITVDPKDPNTVYVANVSLYRSKDGGENFEAIKGAPGGDDYHTLWIASDDSQRMILASDQGAIISVDGGKTWSSWYCQPTAQFYHVTTDDRFPYMVYGSQQDSGTAGIWSRSDYGQLTSRDWSPVGGDESGYIALSPADPNTVYGGGPYGALMRFDWATGQALNISPQPFFGAGKLRFTWTSPLVFSPQNPHTLYLGAQMILQSQDRGLSWQEISPDLTKKAGKSDSSSKQEKDRGVVYTIAPSPVRAGEIWAGTDSGLIQLRTDAGKTWTDVTPPELAEWSMISLIEASHFDAATAYAAVDRHQLDDLHPYIYRTHDFGKTWLNISAGLPAQAYVHAVREDTVRHGLLFAGTELGVFFSMDDGGHWQPLQLNLPVSPIHDIALHGDDVIVATHGRSFWILDDSEPLREWTDQIQAQPAHLYHPARAVRLRRDENHDTPLPPETPVGTNPPAGAIIDYTLKKSAEHEATLEIRDGAGKIIRRYSSESKNSSPEEPPAFPDDWLPRSQPLLKTAGMHRFVWDLRYEPPLALHHEYSMGAIIGEGTIAEPVGPLALPGEYEVRLTVDGTTYAEKLTVEPDPRSQVSREDLAKQLELQLAIGSALTNASKTILEIRELSSRFAALEKRLAGNSSASGLLKSASALRAKADEIAGHPAEYPQMPTGISRVSGSLEFLAVAAGSADSAPTLQISAAYEGLQKQLDEFLTKWEALKKEVAAFNRQLQDSGIPPLEETNHAR